MLRVPGCSEGPSRGGDATDPRAEQANRAEDQPVVVGRAAPRQHPQRSNRYFDFPFILLFLLNDGFDAVASTCLLPVCIETLHIPLRLCCYCWLTSCSAPLHLLLSLLPPISLSLSLSAIVTLPSWSRFCRVSFALSTRPCRTGAHAECLQSLPQIRWNDLSMWIWRFCVSPSQTASSSSTCEAFRSFVLAETYSRPWVASRLLVRLVRT